MRLTSIRLVTKPDPAFARLARRKKRKEEKNIGPISSKLRSGPRQPGWLVPPPFPLVPKGGLELKNGTMSLPSFLEKGRNAKCSGRFTYVFSFFL